jgi:putative FmdB family regulatory protein
MPTYSYRCTECGTAFDIQQAFTDDSLTECPTCGGRLRKLFTTVGVTFNGSGFYRTDSRPADKAGASEPAPAASSPAPASTPAAAPTSKAPTSKE